jgi:hypothetical protein
MLKQFIIPAENAWDPTVKRWFCRIREYRARLVYFFTPLAMRLC